MGGGLGGAGSGVGRGTRPRRSGDQARQAAEGEADDRLLGCAGRQVDLILVFSSTMQAATLIRRSLRVSNWAPPGRASGHQHPQAPQQPVGAGVQKQPELVGGGLGT